jgi:hypothetical protein
MKKEKFKILLEDLYGLYNPEHLKYVDSLVDRYHETPYSAVDMILMKYNHPTFSHYDPFMASDDYKLELIRQYATGERPLLDLNLASEAKKHKDELKEKETIPNKLENGISDMERRLFELEKRLLEDEIEYTVIVNNLDKQGDPVLPNKKQLAALGVGARMVLSLSTGNIAGYSIKDIIYDSVSIPDKVSVTIFIERA